VGAFKKELLTLDRGLNINDRDAASSMEILKRQVVDG
jgi:hypothetical protein